MLYRKIIDVLALIPKWLGSDDPTVIAMNKAKQATTENKKERKNQDILKPAEIFLVRHAESDQNARKANKNRKVADDTLLPANEYVDITENGILQARAGGALFKMLGFKAPDVHYVTGVKRTKMTLAHFAHSAGLDPKISVIENLDLNEIDWGVEDVIPAEIIQELLPFWSEYKEKRKDDKFYLAEHFMGESQWEHFRRVKTFFDTLVRNRSTQRVMVFTHHQTIKEIMACIWMNEWTQYRPFTKALDIANVSMVHLVSTPDNHWRLDGWNPTIKNMDFFNDPFPALSLDALYKRFGLGK
jgi:broad specificity phosphatase PhoE